MVVKNKSLPSSNALFSCFIALMILPFLLCHGKKSDKQLRVLVLSGKNNHDWQKTTPAICQMYKLYPIFVVEVTNHPDTLKYIDLKKFDVIFSNWNTWPDNTFRLPESWENDFNKYMKEGGGAIFLHAGASSFYGWEEFHRIGIGRWGNETHHGKPAKGFVKGIDQNHPITKRMKDFYIKDEIWERTEIHQGAVVLAMVTARDVTDGHSVNEPVVFVSNYEKGRTFYTALGHDEHSLQNPGLQSLLIRATLWVAGRKI